MCRVGLSWVTYRAGVHGGVHRASDPRTPQRPRSGEVLGFTRRRGGDAEGV